MISIPGKIPIHIFPFFWLLIVMIGWVNSGSISGTVIWSVVILISILIHEYGHAWTALAFGHKAEIHLVGLGGLTKREGPKLAPWKEFMIVLDGPLAGLTTFVIADQWIGLGGEKPFLLTYALEIAINVNLFWTLLNLLPVLPLDGGHLLRILLEAAFGLRGLKCALVVSIGLAGIIGLSFFMIQQVLMGALFFMFAFESYRAWADMKSMDPQDADQELQHCIKEGMEKWQQGDSQGALARFVFVRQQAPKGMLYVNATQYGARILAEQGHFKRAYEWLYPLKNRISIDDLRLLQQLAWNIQEWEEAVQIGQQAYQQEPSMESALINALSSAVLGNAVPAVGWLRCAVQSGLPNVQQVIEKREFDAIRHSEPFQKWLKSHIEQV